MANIDVYNKDGEVLKKIRLNKEVFNGKVNKDVLYYYVKVYLANQRQGNADTKTRSDLAGSNKKPWKQKGTGRARAGTRKSPIWRGGGIVFGPHPRSYRLDIPKKVRDIALMSALNSRLNNNNIFVVDKFDLESPKTKTISELFKKLNLGNKVLIGTKDKDDNVFKSVRNLKKSTAVECQKLNAYEILNHEKLVFTEEAIKDLEKRILEKKAEIKDEK